MSFQTIAKPFIELGIPVIPLNPRTKIPPQDFPWVEEATIDPQKVAAWDKECPDYNVGLVAGEYCFLEFDITKGMSKAAEEMGQQVPMTRTQKSGKGFGHYIFRHTERSRSLGNRSVNLPDGTGEWFSFRADRKYLVGAGSVHPNGNHYAAVRNIEPVPIPDWLCDFIEKHSTATKHAPTGSIPVSDAFDFDDFVDYFGIGIVGVKDDVWQVVEECPGVGYRHENSTLTAFFYDGGTLGWSCFAQGCPLHGKSIGAVVRYLNEKKGAPYTGAIWDSADSALDGVEFIDADPELGDGESRIVTPEELEAFMNEPWVAQEQDVAMSSGLASVAVHDPEEHEGVEFPGSTAMYGKLADIANRHEALQLGWLYPSILGVTSALDIEDAQGHVRSNLYVALLGDVGSGKNVHMDAARASIYIPGAEHIVLEDAPGSHSGLMNQLSEDEPLHRLLFLDELKVVLNSCAIQGSNLSQMFCTLFNKDKTGGSVKKGRTVVYGKLSMLGGLAVRDPAEFACLFGAHSVSGMYDRFIFGYSKTRVKYRPSPTKMERIEPQPVRIPTWVWDAKDAWVGDDPSRGRLSELALRVALITAAANGDAEITKPCLEAALRFTEWQLRLRQTFKPGVAETKDAEALESVWGALKEQFNKQKKSRVVHDKALHLEIDMPAEDRWKLIHFTDVLNSKSYYRKYGRYISQVRKTLIDEGFMYEVKENEVDENGKERKGKSKTPFVVLAKEVK